MFAREQINNNSSQNNYFFLLLSSEYEIVAPYEVSHEGAYISHRVSHHERRRRRRSLTPEEQSSNKGSSDEKVHFRLSGLGQDFHLELWEASESLIAPGFTIQVLGKNSTKSLRAYHQDDLCFYQGSLRSKVNSSVALSTCMGMVSLNTHRIRLQKELDEIEGLNDWNAFCFVCVCVCLFMCVKGTSG